MKEEADKNKILKLKKFNTSGTSEIIVNRWWEEDLKDSDELWKSLEHNGVIFPPLFEPSGIGILYKNEKINLTPEQEEIACFWAGILENDLSLKETVQNNFLANVVVPLM
jgi:DNA topoisomerase-1